MRREQAARLPRPASGPGAESTASGNTAAAAIARARPVPAQAGELLARLLEMAPTLTRALEAAEDTARVGAEIEQIKRDAAEQVTGARGDAETAKDQAATAEKAASEALNIAEQATAARTAAEAAAAEATALTLAALNASADLARTAGVARRAALADLADEREAHTKTRAGSERRRVQRETARQELETLRETHAGLVTAHHELSQENVLTVERLTTAKNALTSLTEAHTTQTGEFGELRSAHTLLSRTNGALETELTTLRPHVEDLERKLGEQDREITGQRERIGELEKDVLRQQGETRSAKERADHAARDLKTARGKTTSLEHELRVVRKHSEGQVARLAAAAKDTARVEALERELAALRAATSPPPAGDTAAGSVAVAADVSAGQLAFGDIDTPKHPVEPDTAAPADVWSRVPAEVYEAVALVAGRIDVRKGNAGKLRRQTKRALGAVAMREAKPAHWTELLELLATNPTAFGTTAHAKAFAAALDRVRAALHAAAPLPADTRPTPDLARYDELFTLPGTQTIASEGAAGEAESPPWEAVPRAVYEEIRLAASRINPKVGRAAELPEATRHALEAVAGDTKPSREHLTMLLMCGPRSFGTTENAKRLGRALGALRTDLALASAARDRTDRNAR
jgi:hypothetical protein